jgi:hypothetical protein
MISQTLRIATQHQLKLLEHPPVSKIFPFIFQDTSFELKSLVFTCGSCNEPVDNEDVHGTCSHLIVSVLDLDLVARCFRCNIITPFQMRITSDRLCHWKDYEGIWQQSRIYEQNSKGLGKAWKDLVAVIKDRMFD